MTVGPDGEVLSVTVSEPRFTVQDKVALLVSFREDRAPRSRTGVLLSEAMDPNNQFAFEVPPPATDWSLAAMNAAQDRYRSAWPDADMDSLMWSVKRVP